MKTQVIQLEPHDDIISARDKMGWGQTQRVVLVWPHRSQILTRQLDIELLHRHSRQLGVQIAFVCRNPDVRFFARELGIPVFSTVHKAQTQRWRKVRRGRGRVIPLPAAETADNGTEPVLDRLDELKARARPPTPAGLSRPYIRLGIFAVGVLAILAIAFVLVPSATINLSPSIEDQTVTFTAQANPTIESLQLSGVIPSREVLVIVEGRDSVNASGESSIPGAAATGTIRLTNLTALPVNVPAGTVIRTLSDQPVRFATTRSGIVPPDAEQFLSLPVEALTGGSEGNQPAGDLQAVEGPLGLQLGVSNPLPTIGGTDFLAAAPTNSDRQALREALLASLSDTAALEIQAQVSAEDLVLETPAVVEILEETYDPPDNQPAETITLLLRVAFSAPVARGQDLQELASAILDTSLPDGYRGEDSPVTIRHLTTPQPVNQDTARWQIQAERKIIPEIRANQAINLVLGLPPAPAEMRLAETLDLAIPPDILLTPRWWPRLPILPFRIQVNVELQSSPG